MKTFEKKTIFCLFIGGLFPRQPHRVTSGLYRKDDDYALKGGDEDERCCGKEDNVFMWVSQDFALRLCSASFFSSGSLAGAMKKKFEKGDNCDLKCIDLFCSLIAPSPTQGHLSAFYKSNVYNKHLDYYAWNTIQNMHIVKYKKGK